MAPVTRRRSATSSVSSIKKGGNTGKTGNTGIAGKTRKSPPSPLKSAIRKKLQSPIRERQVKFEAEHDDNAIRVNLPATPYPSSQQLPLSPQKITARAPIEYSRRKEQEELLSRAGRILEARAKTAGTLPTPPQSPPSKKASPVVKPAQTYDIGASTGEAIETPWQSSIQDAKSTKDTTSSTEENFVIATSRHIDKIVDHIPEGSELPASIDNILVDPESDIKMEEICTAFDFLKAQIQIHCRQFYSYTAPAADWVEPSFTYLKVKHLELFRYIQYVADGSQYGWDKLIKIGNQRENLVYAIISRALISHVFDAELFGASAEHEEALLEMCREYLYYDAFVRNTHRAEMVKSILVSEAMNNSTTNKSPYTYFQAAISLLKRRIHALLQPLRVADPNSPPINPQESLHSILQTTLKLHLAIRLAGANGTVYRFEDPHKLSPWEASNMNCINQRKMDLSVHHGEEALVKISCFPAAFATVPNGPNLEQFNNADFVEKWINTADPDVEEREKEQLTDVETDGEGKGKPIITQYPITLADVVLENTPTTDRSGFTTLDQTMRREQLAMSDTALLTLTGINRKRIKRAHNVAKFIHRIVKPKSRRGRIVNRVGLGLVTATAAAAASWYLYQARECVVPAVQGIWEKASRLEGLRSSLGSWRSWRLVRKAAAAAAAATSKPAVVVVVKPKVLKLTAQSLRTRAAGEFVTVV
jgi:hypothetical protein